MKEGMRINREAGGFMCHDSWDSWDLGLFAVSVAISPWIECESTSSWLIAGCLFPFVYTSIFVWVTARFHRILRSRGSLYLTHITECSHTRGLARMAYMSTRRTGHLAPAAARLMQNTTRPGRWQLHQEVGPQQAKCAHRSCPDARWSGGRRRLAGCEPREGWSWEESMKLVKGEKLVSL